MRSLRGETWKRERWDLDDHGRIRQFRTINFDRGSCRTTLFSCGQSMLIRPHPISTIRKIIHDVDRFIEELTTLSDQVKTDLILASFSSQALSKGCQHNSPRAIILAKMRPSLSRIPLSCKILNVTFIQSATPSRSRPSLPLANREANLLFKFALLFIRRTKLS